MKIQILALATLFFSPLAWAKTISLGNSGALPVVTRTEEAARGSDGARVVKVGFALRALRTKFVRSGYTGVSVDRLPLTSDVGQPALPFQAVVVNGAAADVRVAPFLGDPVTMSVGRVLPAQSEPCRCAASSPPRFTDAVDSYQAPASGFVIQSLGDFRGQAVSRVLLFPHRYDPKTGRLTVYPNARFEVRYVPSAKPSVASLYDYLVIAPRALQGGLASWLDWKRSSQGLRFNVVAFEDLGAPTADALKAWIHAEYAKAGFRYALLVGGKAQIPQETVETSTDKKTPSDLPYFTMGGSDDVIPDVLAGRVVASDVETLTRILKKWSDYERDSSSAAGWHRDIGIASNQGANPSDAEYIGSIQDKLKTGFGADAVYLYQNNADSNPLGFNTQMNTGAMWVTYVGHGSGTDWPSFGTAYTIPDIAQLRNASVVKPVWIDVACLNGALEPGAAGANLTTAKDPSGAGTGVTAYVGGTVLVSWNPPAIFARGVAYELASMVAPTLGDAIQAGQRYLAENDSTLLDLQSNQRWYHLQGDPSLRLRLK